MYRFARIVLANHRRLGSYKNQVEFIPKFPKIETPVKLLLGAGIIGFFEKKKDEELEKQETDLIMAIKRGEKFDFNSCATPVNI